MIYYAPKPDDPITAGDSIDSTWEHAATGQEIGGLRQMETYTVCMRARNAYGFSPVSNCVDVRIEAGGNVVC